MNISIAAALRMEEEFRLRIPDVGRNFAAHGVTLNENAVRRPTANEASIPSPIPSARTFSPANSPVQKSMSLSASRL
jgi:hypothetical protein